MSEATIGTVISGIRLDAEIGRGGMGDRLPRVPGPP